MLKSRTQMQKVLDFRIRACGKKENCDVVGVHYAEGYVDGLDEVLNLLKESQSKEQQR